MTNFFNSNMGCRNSTGQAMIEFVLVFPVVMLLIMGILEFALLTVAHQVVDYAAYTSARSASVGGSYRIATALTVMPISPSSIQKIDPGNIPGIKQVTDLINGIIGITNGVEKATFGYFLTLQGSGVTYYDRSGKKVSKLSDASYLDSKVVYCYPLKFPLISTVAAMVSRSRWDKIPVIGDIFYISPIDDTTYFQNYLICEGYSKLSGLKFVPIIKRCRMGLN